METIPSALNTDERDANSTRFILPIVIALACLLALVITGCASESSSSSADSESSTQTPEATAEQASEEATEQENVSDDSADASTDVQESAETQPAAGTGSTHAFEPPSEEEVALNNEWADTTVRNALVSLADEGVIEQPASDAELLQQAFQYDYADAGFGVDFLDEEAGNDLSGEYELPAGKVIIGRVDYSPGSTRPIIVDYANGDWTNEAISGDVPLFYPESLKGHFSEELLEATLADVPADTFANSTDECDYLVVFDAVDSHVDEDFYMSNIDRTAVTTLVLVIDAKQGKIVHIENVGTDMPGNVVEMGGQTGDMLWDELGAYLNGLLLNRADS